MDYERGIFKILQSRDTAQVGQLYLGGRFEM
jgi:hypothetical protein